MSNFVSKYVFFLPFVITFLFVIAFNCEVTAQRKFTVVIDAGHGGKDPGAKGKFSSEKTINLAVALKLGEKISSQNPDINVLYTRKKDVYLTVAERPKYANDVHADLFISIHANSTNSNPAAAGIETYTLGTARTNENLQVAMMENSVILLEDNYKQHYQGFDPNSIDSYIMFEFMQDKYMAQSIRLASLVQEQCTGPTCKRADRGVRQAGFLVLKNTAMPSILVELGFISNSEEEKYLNSKAGIENLASAVYNAFSVYKKEFDKKSNVAINSSPSVSSSSTDKSALKNHRTYKVQLFLTAKKIGLTDSRFKGLKPISYYREGNVYKYTYGETADYVEALKLQKEAQNFFKEAFIISFMDGKRAK